LVSIVAEAPRRYISALSYRDHLFMWSLQKQLR